jgi:peptidyl-tRNA hydrolase
MKVGKIAEATAQISVMAYEECEPRRVKIWRMFGEAIVVLKVPTLESLNDHVRRAEMDGI